jgi:hypothetical protein
MEKVTSESALRKAALTIGPDSIEVGVRGRIREWIEELVEAELTAALGAELSARPGTSRRGYRHGHRDRTLSTSLGPSTFQLPRARVQTATGGMQEWQSVVVPRYQRRTARVDEALLGVYLSGTNGRRIRSALAPLLKGAPLSKDAVSRLTGRLAGDFAAWRSRDLATEQIRYLFLDGWYPKVRLGKQRVRVPTDGGCYSICGWQAKKVPRPGERSSKAWWPAMSGSPCWRSSMGTRVLPRRCGRRGRRSRCSAAQRTSFGTFKRKRRRAGARSSRRTIVG